MQANDNLKRRSDYTTRSYKGVQLRGGSVRIYYNYNGKRHYKTMPGTPTPAYMRECAELVAEIERQIRTGVYNHADFVAQGQKEARFGSYIRAWLDEKQSEVAKSSFKSYLSRCNNWILPQWGAMHPEGMHYRAIQTWTRKTLMPSLSNKTIRDVHSIMAQAFQFYRLSTGSAHDPMEGISVRLADPPQPDPFTRAEIKQILSTSNDANFLNLVAFMLWSGARISEAIALAWDDVDLERGTVMFQRARVASQYKITKTRRSTRKIKLLSPAADALRDQLVITGSLPLETVEVLQRDNRTAIAQRLSFCFRNPNTGMAFSTADNLRHSFWNEHLERAGVRHRGPNQCRHTFASQMLSSGVVSVDWVADQLGHASSAMVWRHYGKWIVEDEADSVGAIERALNLN